MRLATVRQGNGTRAVVVGADHLELLPHPDVGSLLVASARRGGDGLRDLSGTRIAGLRAEFAPVVPRPSKVLCVGLNYRDHIFEMSRVPPEYPTLFAKFGDTLMGADDDLVLPSGSTSVDWEAELAVVVGRTVRHASVSEAGDAIAGFTVANDVSMRDWQHRSGQWLQGKAFDATTPLGPVLVTPDELDGAANLGITCTVDGVLKQRSSTSQLLFAPADLIAYVSRFTTLRPGDIVLTGTPGGVGAARKPPEFLRAGQVLETTIEGIGTCRNTCVQEASA
ncbi:fumarylacetoacetate hydrolase family protein [Embleya hyalina]|uniref:2-hydroxyhepta-2,4-diene-1,7-dioate isomerase n=1 Tax=Embleya hyalina TaxID=516124 RepID=A0A401YQT7_9ACTN|nr:fumarylacetoacetate hydrolase family protein [Embleya hyalina]GCD96984.1 2-hydroxyhepta-2,4-diene-1,7-dioate isomerase [Embleya hyalina]